MTLPLLVVSLLVIHVGALLYAARRRATSSFWAGYFDVGTFRVVYDSAAIEREQNARIERRVKEELQRRGLI